MKNIAQIVYRRLRATSPAFTPLRLFASGEQGVWYDPSDMTTLFQDSAGATPVTAVEQPVGRILDKSGRGNHATQSTSAARPVLSALVNIATKTEQFNDAYWSKFRTTIVADTSETLAPDGTQTADIMRNQATTNWFLVQGPAYSNPSATLAHTVTFHAKKKSVRYISCGWSAGSTVAAGAGFDLDTGTVTGFGQTGAGYTANSASMTSVGNGWYRCSVTVLGPASNVFVSIFNLNAAYTGGAGTTYHGATYTGTTSEETYIWGADLRVSNIGVGLPAYQRVNTSTDYDTVGFPMYLRFDGTNDQLVTGSIDFTSTDKMTVWAGVCRLTEASFPMICELSSGGWDTNNGAFGISGGTSGASSYRFGVRGTAATYYDPVTYTPPITNILCGAFDIAGASKADAIKPRVNGVLEQEGGAGTTAGSGNFGNLPLYIGRRGTNTLPFNGHIYSLIVRGAATTANQIIAGEAWVNGKTNAY